MRARKYGLARRDTNFQLYKDFPLVKDSRAYIQLRLESYNVFNHTNFAEPDGNFGDSTFGQIESVIQPGNFGITLKWVCSPCPNANLFLPIF